MSVTPTTPGSGLIAPSLFAELLDSLYETVVLQTLYRQQAELVGLERMQRHVPTRSVWCCSILTDCCFEMTAGRHE